MNDSSNLILRSSISLAFAGLLTGLASSACDLPDKNLGKDPVGTTGDPGTCEPGDTKVEDCNECSCEDGEWACTQMACTDSGGLSCDPETEPFDECNECDCVDGEWQCTTLACADSGDPPGTDTDGCDPESEPFDGCNECSCVDGEWACTDMACPAIPVAVCDGSEPLDALTVTAATVLGDALALTVEVGGGCAPHVFGSCWDGTFDESSPVQTGVTITHESNDDPCDALLTNQVEVDLVPMRDAWIAAYGGTSGTIILNVAGWGAVQYDF